MPVKSLRIALYPGDGIGPEVMAQAVRVLERAQAHDGTFRLELTRLPWGADYYFQHGQAAPDDFLEQLRGFNAILLGAVGDPQRLPDHVTLAPLVRIRQGFGAAAQVIREATEAALAGEAKTPDLGGTLTTAQMTDQILSRLEEAQ
jgi:tartrate dehydrogenase/decarboxylase/D-malate dehydrogenase